MENEKCDSCKLRYVCEEQAEFICKQRDYCDYSPDRRMHEKANEKRPIYAEDLKAELLRLSFSPAIVMAAMDRMPTADAKPVVHGRWINWGKSGTPTYENYGTCSVCHEDAEICTEHRNYCPNCGAKMDGGNEDAKN